MKIVFMGTPEFAIPSLKILLESNHNVVAVVSALDKKRGRGKQISFTPVKEFALQNKLEVLSPVTLKDAEFVKRLKELQPDLFVVVAFRILPKEVYTIPAKGAFNLHGSLLPKYRGAAPIQWALINGEKETGLTTFFLEDRVDTGNIIIQEKIVIEDSDDFGSLHDKMMILGADVVIRTVNMIASGEVKTFKQDDSLASPAQKIAKEICQISWDKSAEVIHNLIRGLSPHPGAFFEYDGKTFKLFKTKIMENGETVSWQARLTIENSNINSQLATLNSKLSVTLIQTKKEIFISIGNDLLQILELQPEGRKRMTAEEFLRGYSFIK
ncbi:methionyl-tRNA formyltransferase [bacterium]|nr:methionyl-tRNA formyltransferase [bacterium]